MYGYNDYMGPYGMNNFNNAPRMQTMQAMPQPVQENNGMDIAYVQNMNQVEQVQVLPGSRKLIMVQNDPVVALRVADNMGLVTTDYYKLVKFSPSDNDVTEKSDVSDKYVTQEQLEARLNKLVESIQANIINRGDAE